MLLKWSGNVNDKAFVFTKAESLMDKEDTQMIIASGYNLKVTDN